MLNMHNQRQFSTVVGNCSETIQKSMIKNIWIETEECESIINSQNNTNDNSDVIVTFSDDKKYVASFFTYDNIKTLTEKNKKTGELLNGKYFWSSDMILIDRIDRNSIEKVISDLIKENSFYQIFKLIEK